MVRISLVDASAETVDVPFFLVLEPLHNFDQQVLPHHASGIKAKI